MRLSKNFTLSELTESNTAERFDINNNPNDAVIINLTTLVEKILQPLRDELKEPIIISSGYRSIELNKKIGGSSTSEHCKGLAVDIKAINGNNKVLFYTIIKMNLPFRQMIWEFGDDNNPKWVHVSVDLSSLPKREMLKAVKIEGKTIYQKIL